MGILKRQDVYLKYDVSTSTLSFYENENKSLPY